MLSETRVQELLDYASSYGSLDENSPNGTLCEHGGSPMCDTRRAAIMAYKRVLELLPDNVPHTSAPNKNGARSTTS